MWRVVFVLVALSACSGDRRRGQTMGNDGTDGGGGKSTNDAAASSGDAGSGVLSCSSDLQNVVDSSGSVVTVCPPDEGCLAGACVPACQAAAGTKGSVGCDFLAATPAFSIVLTAPCFAVFVANNWGKAVNITVSQGATSYDATKFGRIASSADADATHWATLPSTGLPPGEVAVLFLSSDPNSSNLGTSLACPVPQATPGGTGTPSATGVPAGSGLGTAFAIHTDVPVSAYDILPYGGAKSFLPAAELLLPTSVWGTTYVAVVPPNQRVGERWLQVIASTDATTVQIKPTTSLPAGTGVPAAPANTVTSVMLNAGQFAQWQDAGEVSGSVVIADKPVVVVGGTTTLCLDSSTSPTGGGCDSAHQMTPPVSALGSAYAIAPFVTRMASLQPESILYRIVGGVDGTTLVFDPAVTGAPAALARGSYVDFQTTTPFTVTSQDSAHPFFIAQLMPGCTVTGGSRAGVGPAPNPGDCLGDEEFVNELPPAQFLGSYVFFTDPTYATTNLVVTRVAHNGTFSDVSVDCAGTLTNWMPIGTSGDYQYTQLDLERAGVGVGACTNGPHTAKSDGPFGLMVWGTDSYASYAYPAGGNVGSISTATIIF